MNKDSFSYCFDNCYKMRHEDIERFAETLTDGFSKYNLYEYVCNGQYDYDKMMLFWKVSVLLVTDNAICIADSHEMNSVIVYIPPKTKEPGLLSYLKAGGLKMLFKVGVKTAVRLLRFDDESKKVAKKHKKDKDGYLMAFATRLDKQGQGYGKPLLQALLQYLDASGEGCYLETLKPENVGIYKRYGFVLEEETVIKNGDLPLYAMRRVGGKS